MNAPGPVLEVHYVELEGAFDIGMLAHRLIAARHWLDQRPETAALDLGYFGSSTGGGAALVAAAEEPHGIAAVVSRGGRPDLAGPSRNPAELVVAVPVAAERTCNGFRRSVDAVVCSITPEPFGSVGAWYEEFGQTSDQEVKELLAMAEREPPRHQ